MILLLSCEWVAMTGRWLFRGERQPIPYEIGDRLKLKSVLLDLISAAPNELQARYRYLDAVLKWLTTDEAAAREAFRTLASETEYVERGRVLKWHIVADNAGKPTLFDGVIERQLADKHWSVFIQRLSRRVDFVEGERERSEVKVGATLRGLVVSFNYLGPIVDPLLSARRQ